METIIIDDKTVSVNGVQYLRKEEPEFKVGQWVIGLNGGTPYNPARITRLANDNDNVVRYLYWDGKKETDSFMSQKYIRPATHSEIESHLIKVAKEKGFTRGVTINHPNYNTEYNIISTDGYNYSSLYDHLSLGGVLIYQRGKWAEIIPPKKKLPRTKDEIHQLINDYDEWLHNETANYTPISNFLENYED